MQENFKNLDILNELDFLMGINYLDIENHYKDGEFLKDLNNIKNNSEINLNIDKLMDIENEPLEDGTLYFEENNKIKKTHKKQSIKQNIYEERINEKNNYQKKENWENFINTENSNLNENSPKNTEEKDTKDSENPTTSFELEKTFELQTKSGEQFSDKKLENSQIEDKLKKKNLKEYSINCIGKAISNILLKRNLCIPHAYLDNIFKECTKSNSNLQYNDFLNWFTDRGYNKNGKKMINEIILKKNCYDNEISTIYHKFIVNVCKLFLENYAYDYFILNNYTKKIDEEIKLLYLIEIPCFISTLDN